MALDTAQKRMSAIAPGCPWRGPLVASAEAGFTEGNRRAAAFLYSGLSAAGVVAPRGLIFTAESLAAAGILSEALAAASMASEALAGGGLFNEVLN